MRLTTRGRYAVTAMLDLALSGRKGPVSVAAISSNPDGIDYQTNSNSLIISRGDTLGTDKNFKRLDSAYPWRFVE